MRALHPVSSGRAFGRDDSGRKLFLSSRSRALAVPLPDTALANNHGCADATKIRDVDVVVIGSGIGGLCAAAMLAKCGLSACKPF